MSSRFALIADIHGNLPALEAVVNDIAAHGVTAVVNLGDHLSGPLWPRETADYLMQRDWPSISGNHDRQLACDDPASHVPSDRFAFAQINASHLEWLGALPATLSFDEQSVFVCHGIPADDNAYLADAVEHGRLRAANPSSMARQLEGVSARLVACGHSHFPRLLRLADGGVVMNPGSVGLQAYEAAGPPAHVSETGSPYARYALVTLTDQGPRVSFRAIPYDFEAAARRAARNGRDDWAFALRTGYAQSSHASGDLSRA